MFNTTRYDAAMIKNHGVCKQYIVIMIQNLNYIVGGLFEETTPLYAGQMDDVYTSALRVAAAAEVYRDGALARRYCFTCAHRAQSEKPRLKRVDCR